MQVGLWLLCAGVHFCVCLPPSLLVRFAGVLAVLDARFVCEVASDESFIAVIVGAHGCVPPPERLDVGGAGGAGARKLFSSPGAFLRYLPGLQWSRFGLGEMWNRTACDRLGWSVFERGREYCSLWSVGNGE